ncbi:hypothetical protein BH23GEM1_BH23GEM1_03110 [soil metagenome]
MIFIGPAGWSYKDWYGKVYPSPKPRGFDELAYIARYFDTVEVNSSFYAPMRAAQTATWIERTAHNPRFLFTVKLLGRFVNIDQPPGTGITPSARATAPVGYIRLHGRNLDSWFRGDAGVNERYDYLYSARELEPWRDRALQLERESRQVFVITNNHFEGQAVANAAMLKAGIERRAVQMPPTLFDAYPELLQGITTAT